MQTKPVIFIDALNLFVRHFTANKALNADGEPVGGCLGFLKAVSHYIRLYTPSKVIVCWESSGGSPRRKKIYSEYKAHRYRAKPAEARFVPDQQNKLKQLQILTQALGFLPVVQIFVQDAEADDIIAYLAKHKFQDQKKLIISSDKDYYQLLSDKNVTIFDPSKQSFFSYEEVRKKYENVLPENICLLRTIVGDASDNIHGVPGIGLKTALKQFPFLADKEYEIPEFIEEIKNKLQTTKKPSKALSDVLLAEDIIHRNWKLMYLDTNCLSASQVDKINYRLAEYRCILNKLEFLKVLVRNQVAITEEIDAIPSGLNYLLFEE